MGNMSYCRFENTARDLGEENLSHYELNGLALIVEYANDIIDMEDYINDILDGNE